MKQCYLENHSPLGKRCMTVWLPKEFAIKDKVLRLKEGNMLSDGWVVCGVYPHEMTWFEVNEQSQNYKDMSTYDPRNY